MTASTSTIPTPKLHLPAGTLADGDDRVALDPERAGWRYAALRVLDLAPGARRTIETDAFETAVLPLAGGDVEVTVGGETLHVDGRSSVFESVAGFAYLPCRCTAELHAPRGAQVALPAARTEVRIDPYAVPAAEVAVEIRGSGRATRQLNNFLAPGVGRADKLVAVEVLTPRGNWSSYPPHKHDVEVAASGGDHPYAEAELEEIYYFQISGGADGFGMHRTYDLEQGWDVSVAVRTHDVFLVPRGYHGPCVAAPEYDMYYLNVLAGRGAERSLAFSDDPALAYVRGTWPTQQPDERVPMTRAEGKVQRP